jgi:hypothetical protein
MGKKKKTLYDPYAEALEAFNRHGVLYVVVGMAGINYYASRAEDTFSTQDYDVFIKPVIANVKKVVQILKELGYDIAAGGKLLADSSLINIVRDRKTLIATDPYGISFDIILAISGFTFNQMAGDATIFSAGKIPLRVGKLKKLLLSKKAAGRKKDILFLATYENMISSGGHT